ncbi:MAG: AraC family transcriptional regulator [Acidiferrobacterales bacterium]
MYTSLASTALLIWKALESYGCDAEVLFKQAGLEPNKMRDPNARYPDAAFLKLYKRAIEATKDASFGLTVARFWHPTSFHALGYAWLASDSLCDALERATRYSKILNDKEQILLEETDDAFRVVFHNPDPDHPTADEDYDAAFAVTVDLCRTSYGKEFNPLRVAMTRDAPTDRGAFASVFRAPIKYSAQQNILFLGKQELNAQLPTANAELARANDRIVADYLARFERGSIKRQVEAKLLEQLSSGHATQESIAKALNVSTRSLQRKLKQEGTTYKQLLEQTRRELAAQYVKQSQLSINEITFLLGFSEPANFSRAFKRWTGLSPSEYRLSA